MEKDTNILNEISWSNSLEIPSLIKSNTTEEDYQVINEEREKITNSSLSDGTHDKNKNINYLLKNSIVVESENDKKSGSMWSSFSNGISKLTNSLKYNLINTNSYVNFNKLPHFRIFDQQITKENENKLDMEIAKIIQFTYRSDFPAINHKNSQYTSDCGWGCMIRAAQMLLSKCILENKIYELKEELSPIILNKLKYDTILLFFDNNLKCDEVIGNNDFHFYFENFKKIISEKEKDFIHKSKSNIEEGLIMNSQDYKNFEEDMNSSHTLNVKEIVAPFSIQNICKLAEKFEVGA